MSTESLAVVIPLLMMTILDAVIIIKAVRAGVRTLPQKVFTAFAVCVLIQQALSALAFASDYHLIPFIGSTTATISYTIAIICMSGTSFLWFMYLITLLRNSIQFTAHAVACLLPITIFSFLVILSPWTGWIFTIDDSGAFHNGPCYYLQLLCPVSYTLLAVAYAIYEMQAHHKLNAYRMMRHFGLGLIPAFVGAAIQFYVFRGGYSQIGISAGLLLMYLELFLEEIRETRYLRRVQGLNEQLREAIDAKTRFLNNMSHDIRTPMNAIIGFTDMAVRHSDDPEIVADSLKKIKRSGEYLLTIINNVLDLARIESGKESVDEDFYDLLDERASAVPLFEGLMAEKNLMFITPIKVQHRYVFLDKTKTLQVVVNLLSNAVKYTPEGGTVTMSMTEVPCTKPGYGTYVLKISDTGIGMSPEYAAQVFEAFSRERNTTESKILGTGLGMAIVKKLVELMDGKITLETKLGKGTTYTITYTHRLVEHPEIYLNTKKPKLRDSSQLKGKRVLLAEDNELNAEIATDILEEMGIHVSYAADGVECVKMVTESPAFTYDIILMDIQMPNLNGYMASLKIRRLDDINKSRIPIIAMTANAFEEDRQRAMAAGMNAHLSKPIDIDKLVETLQKFC